MMDIFIEMISYPFMVRAIIVGCLVSLCASLLGTSLVLKRYSMIGDGLSHVGFAALAIAYAFHAEPLTISIPACIAAADSKDSAAGIISPYILPEFFCQFLGTVEPQKRHGICYIVH